MIKTLVKNVTYPVLMSRPDFLVIGAQKAGTTSLYNYLIQHPQIIGNKSWKEIRYFDLPENYEKGFGWYLGNFPSKLKKGDRLTFDASPSYLYFDYIPELIKKDLGDIKMIAILRNPVDRAYSAWQMYHSFADNSIDFLREIADTRTFAQAIDQELNGPNTAQYPYDYIDRGKYVYQLKNYYQTFDQNGLLLLNFNHFKKDLTGLLNQTCDFLELERFSEEKLQEFQQTKYNKGKYKYEKTEEDLKVLEELKAYFVPYNQELYNFLGEDYNW